MSRKSWCFVVPVALLLVIAPVLARDLAYSGWGLRAGLADDPDQVLFGAHLDLGEFAEQVRFVPSVELGVGDDHTILAFTAPALYRWEGLEDTDVVPYAGGGLTAALIDHDSGHGRGDDNDFELAVKAIGGAEWQLPSGRRFSVELQLVFGDVYDLQVLAGWTFSGRAARRSDPTH